jgi:ABC-type transport system substrate-binding protein
LFYGPEGKVKKSGENAANYDNAEFNKLFEQMKNMDNNPERQRIINRMVEILRHDAPWIFGYHPKDFTLAHSWIFNRKPNHMANNGVKYQRLDPVLRERLRTEWNAPVLWPIFLTVLLLIAMIAPAVISYRKREKAVIKHD